MRGNGNFPAESLQFTNSPPPLSPWLFSPLRTFALLDRTRPKGKKIDQYQNTPSSFESVFSFFFSCLQCIYYSKLMFSYLLIRSDACLVFSGLLRCQLGRSTYICERKDGLKGNNGSGTRLATKVRQQPIKKGPVFLFIYELASTVEMPPSGQI